jgi:predicted dehydrogenase
MRTGDLRVGPLVTATIPVSQAPDAYGRLQGTDAGIAVLLDYGAIDVPAPQPARSLVLRTESRPSAGQVTLGVIGAGTFYRGVHQPNLARHGGFFIKTICTRSGLSARDAAERHGVPVIATDPMAVLDDASIEAVLIATRHGDHAALAVEAARRGKHVFVEKPMGLTVAECEGVLRAVEETGVLMAVGFNRRFSPLAVEAKRAFDAIGGPRTVLYRVNAGMLPPDHWLRDPMQGGGRLRGEGVHFFDFVRWLVGREFQALTALSTRRGDGNDPDDATVSIGFADGSVATVVYCGSGAAGLGKERVELFGGGQAIVLHDFKRLDFHGVPGRSSQATRQVEKGHFEILKNFHEAIRGAAPLGVTARDGYWATWCAERALAAITGPHADA